MKCPYHILETLSYHWRSGRQAETVTTISWKHYITIGAVADKQKLLGYELQREARKPSGRGLILVLFQLVEVG